jgi:hypothetical protein
VLHPVGRELLDTAFIICHPGVDDENVYLAVCLLDGIKTLGYLLFIGRVAPNKTGAYVTGNLLTRVTTTGNRYGGAAIYEVPGNCQADTAGATCNECDFFS